jgi:hypothetical protein
VLKIKFIKIDFVRIAKEAFITPKMVIISDADASIINLNLISTKAKVIIALTFSLKTFFIHDFMKMSKLTIR